MTLHDKRRFAIAFNRLAVATRLPADQADAVAQRIYFEGLETFPIEAVEDAARRLSHGAEWFPKLALWRETAEQARNARALAAALPDSGRSWQSECATCDDTGWEILECSGRQQCGRPREHQPHSYSVPCGCRASNHTYQRRQAEHRERVRGKKEAVEA